MQAKAIMPANRPTANNSVVGAKCDAKSSFSFSGGIIANCQGRASGAPEEV
jgi:hypothetical protein